MRQLEAFVCLVWPGFSGQKRDSGEAAVQCWAAESAGQEEKGKSGATWAKGGGVRAVMLPLPRGGQGGEEVAEAG